MKMGFDLAALDAPIAAANAEREAITAAFNRRVNEYCAAMVNAYTDTAHSDLQDIREEDFSGDLISHINKVCRDSSKTGTELWAARPITLRRKDGKIYIDTARPGRA